jgi:dTDP-4-amino-4,6-dideoxygalactose transaminase
VLSAADIAADVYCDPPLHRHPALRGYRLSRSGLGASDDWSEQELSLPMFPELTAEEVTRVAEILEPVLT